jgi:hypothetical protein
MILSLANGLLVPDWSRAEQAWWTISAAPVLSIAALGSTVESVERKGEPPGWADGDWWEGDG